MNAAIHTCAEQKLNTMVVPLQKIHLNTALQTTEKCCVHVHTPVRACHARDWEKANYYGVTGFDSNWLRCPCNFTSPGSRRRRPTACPPQCGQIQASVSHHLGIHWVDERHWVNGWLTLKTPNCHHFDEHIQNQI